MKDLTNKEKAFVLEYLKDLNGSRAYMSIYKNCKKERAASACASRLLSKANVKSYMEEQMQKIEDEAVANVEEIMKYLTSVMRGKSSASVLALCGDGFQEVVTKAPDEKERLKAAELLGKRYQMFTDKIEVKDEAEQDKRKSISNLESLVRQMVPVKEDDVDE